MAKYKDKALKEHYKDFCSWLQNNMNGLNGELSYNIDMCAEEIFSNIVFYAYPGETGDIEVDFTKTENEIILEFIDSGIEYNPLEKPDPDITLPPEQRPVGGLGVFFVKQLTSELFYKRIDGKNILTLKFAL